MEFPRKNFELIVVDNGSDDNTSEVASSFMSATDINWKIIPEPVAGMCRARNTGIAHARGAWIAFLDDDALVPRDWLGAYQRAINAYPAAAALGGPATLDPRLVRPWWWSSRFDMSMSCQDYGQLLKQYDPKTHPYGLNMVFRSEILQKYRGFDVTLDKIIPGLADETDLFYRMRENAELVIYVPESRVVHSVLPQRLQWKAFRNRCIQVGQTFACLENRHNARMNRPLLRRLVSAALQFLSQPNPAFFLKEYYEWYGYVKFKRENIPG